MKYKLTLAFDGSAFSGWQSQKNAATLQGEMTRAVRIILGEDATVTGSSRTDSGVHAKGYVCHVESRKTIPSNSLVSALNNNLDRHLAVLSCDIVPDDFHARYSAVAKEYHYHIYTGNTPDPFLISRTWFYNRELDVKRMNDAAGEFVGTHDFSAFMSSGSKIENTSRTVFAANVEKIGREVIFSVKADGFLYNMVRIMTGTLVEISNGKIKESIGDIIRSCDRSRAGITAPPDGLYLYTVFY